MKIKTKCYFCNQKELEVEIPHVDLNLGPGPENWFGVDCDCYLKNSNIDSARTRFYWDGVYDYTIRIQLNNKTFYFFYVSKGGNCIQNDNTEFSFKDAFGKYSVLATFPGHFVTLDNAFEKLQKYLKLLAFI